MMNRSLKLLWILLMFTLNVQAQDENEQEDELSKHVFGVTWNIPAIVYNYPMFQLGVQYNLDYQMSFELSGGVLTNSEIYSVDRRFMDHESGYSLSADFKYYSHLKNVDESFYMGVGYSYLSSSFSSPYIIRHNVGDERYFQNVERTYSTEVNRYYLKLGFRFLSFDRRLLTEFGLNVGVKQKEISPEPDTFGGSVVSNEGLVNDVKDFNIPVVVEFKLGLLINP